MRSRRVQESVGGGRVEVHQLRIGHGALEVDVQAAAVAVGPGALVPLYGAGVGKLGDALGLRRLHAAAADAQVEQAGRCKGLRRGSVRPGRRRRDWRASSVLPGSFSSNSGRACEDWR